ncbi:hypothetical protein H0H92_009570 [Tricholoma furcatifolium]|nr:hypothetical protein H0H92_009570 [Tricholoma furcatifolium]
MTLFTSPWPPYDPTDKSGFSYDTVVKRWPIIITGVIDQLHRDCHGLAMESQQAGADTATLEAKIAEGRAIIEKLSKLKYEMGRDHPLPPIPDDGEPAVETYNKELERLGESSKKTWFTAPWLYAECYLYRLIRAYCSLTIHWHGYDAFLPQKMSTFSQSGTSIRQIASSMHELELERKVLDQEKLAILFREMLQMCLWGNATDLSLLTHMSADDIEHLQAVGKEAQTARQQFILKDDQEQLWKHVSSLKEGRVDWVLDNCGSLSIALNSLRAKQNHYAAGFELIPWFVSDVTPPDFKQAITSLLDSSFFTASGNSADEHLTGLVTRWKKYLEQGIFKLSVPVDTPLGGNAPAAEFWTSPWPYWNMDQHAPELFETLKKSDLVIFKGDLNYRKLTGDVRWPAWTPFETAIGLLAFSIARVRAIITRYEHECENTQADRHVTVLILGGGVAGVIAARTFHEQGIEDFLVVEAQDELGGRLKSTTFGGKTVELGANWIQGLRMADGSENPILTLAKKHKVKTQFNDQYGSIETYDTTGAVDYMDVFNASVDAFTNLTIYGGEGGRLSENVVDLSSRSAFDLIGWKPQNARAKAAEYFNIDFEFAQKPDQSSALGVSWVSGGKLIDDYRQRLIRGWITQNNNYTYSASQGASEENLLCIDQRGFKAVIQEEAREFLQPHQLLLNSTVRSISWSGSSVRVTLKNGSSISADYAVCTFSLGVLQNDDIRFVPSLPSYKSEAIASMTMATYTKIFLQFPQKFWFDTEMGLYADPERGRYPVWQSLDHENFLPGSKIVFVTVTGDFSERIEALPSSQVKAEVLSVLQSMFPNISIPPTLDFYFPRWHSDPLFRGSYSNWPPSFVRQHHANLRVNVDRLYFAGEATSLEYYGESTIMHLEFKITPELVL